MSTPAPRLQQDAPALDISSVDEAPTSDVALPIASQCLGALAARRQDVRHPVVRTQILPEPQGESNEAPKRTVDQVAQAAAISLDQVTGVAYRSQELTIGASKCVGILR